MRNVLIFGATVSVAGALGFLLGHLFGAPGILMSIPLGVGIGFVGASHYD